MKSEALGCWVAERRHALTAARFYILLEMQQGVQLRRMLPEHQRGGDKDVT